MPVRLTRSSTDLKRKGASTGSLSWFVGSWVRGFVGFVGFVKFVRFQSWAQLLQKYDPAFTVSSIDSSSHPHFGQVPGIRVTELIPNPRSLLTDFSMARPTSSRSPET